MSASTSNSDEDSSPSRRRKRMGAGTPPKSARTTASDSPMELVANIPTQNNIFAHAAATRHDGATCAFDSDSSTSSSPPCTTVLALCDEIPVTELQTGRASSLPTQTQTPQALGQSQQQQPRQQPQQQQQQPRQQPQQHRRHRRHGSGSASLPCTASRTSSPSEDGKSCSPSTPPSEPEIGSVAAPPQEVLALALPCVGDFTLSLEETLGRGAFSTVVKGIHEKTKEEVAVKVLLNSGSERIEAINRELKSTQSAQTHPNIVKLIDFINCKDTSYFVFELCSHGEVFAMIEPDVGLPRQLIPRMYSQLVSAVAHLHGRGIAHLDIKCENMLVDAEGNLKLCDFGLSVSVTDGPLSDARGSFSYASPENLRCYFQPCSSFYSPIKADIWSCAIVLFVFLYGKTPWKFARDTCPQYHLFRISDGFSSLSPWSKMSSGFRNLFHRMLAASPDQRMNITEVHEYLHRRLGWKQVL
eukprot:m.96180 g.96180  ORF g.96180 m.96180 type:complete len:471 (+) comp13066_c0_seq1:670-2082(+)